MENKFVKAIISWLSKVSLVIVFMTYLMYCLNLDIDFVGKCQLVYAFLSWGCTVGAVLFVCLAIAFQVTILILALKSLKRQ